MAYLYKKKAYNLSMSTARHSKVTAIYHRVPSPEVMAMNRKQFKDSKLNRARSVRMPHFSILWITRHSNSNKRWSLTSVIVVKMVIRIFKSSKVKAIKASVRPQNLFIRAGAAQAKRVYLISMG